MIRFILLFFVLFYTFPLLSQSPALRARIAAVENNLMPYTPVEGFAGWNIADRMAYYKVPGLSIAVIRDYKIDFVRTYGYADTTAKLPVTPNTMFSAGSISKLVMAVAALRLVEKGYISLDDPVNSYLTSWKIADNDFTRQRPVTLRMLLSHTGGTTQSSYFGFTPDTSPLPTILDIVSGAPISGTRPVVVNSEPGVAFRYSGGGSMISQLALMDVTGQSFADLTNQLVFSKSGMKHTTFAQPVPKKFQSYCAWGYSSASWYQGMPYVYPQQAAAGLYTTPTDLAKLFISIQLSLKGEDGILSRQMAKEFVSPQAEVSSGSYLEQIGVGPFLLQTAGNTDPKGVYFEFTGVNAGFLAYAIGSVEGGNGVVIMMNSGDDVNGLGKEIRRSVAKAYQWPSFLLEAVRPVSLPESQLEKLTGRYRKGPDEVIYLRRENDYLVERINEGNDIYCFPISPDTIVFTDYNIKGGFVLDASGVAQSLQTAWQPAPMPRMADNEFTPGEYLRRKQYEEAKAGYAAMGMNEYQITYLAYELQNKKPDDAAAVRAVLEVAAAQHPQSSIVFSRWGDFYLKYGTKEQALANYEKALELDPTDEVLKKAILSLRN